VDDRLEKEKLSIKKLWDKEFQDLSEQNESGE
jgi:hypothetical protein